MKRIDVYYEGWGEYWLLGHLAHRERDLFFEYSEEALNSKLELSPINLALRAQTYSDFPASQMRLPGLIADSLPDGWGMLLMDRLFRKQGLNVATLSPLDRLAFVGNRTMGALTFKPAQDMDVPGKSVDLLQLAKHTQKVMSGKDSELLTQMIALGGSPHGARPKVLVHYCAGSNQMSNEPFAGSTPWLVKFQAQNEHHEVCAIEWCYAQLAHACGLDMPATKHFKLSPKLAAFGIERFDVHNGLRVPVHTLAGATDTDFRVPGSLDYLTFLRVVRAMTRSQLEVNKGFERAVFNVLFNNRDDHPKNFSFRMNRTREWQLSPAYDLTYCAGPGGYHQMDVQGQALCITRKHVLDLAKKADVPAKFAVACLDKQLDVASRFSRVLAEGAIRKATIKTLVTQVELNANGLR